MSKLVCLLSDGQKQSFISGDCSSSVKIPIDGRFPAEGMNLISSRYDAGCPIARIGADNEGFVYLPAPYPISNENVTRTLCYAKKVEDEKTFFVIGIGNGAKNAKQPIIDHTNKGKIHWCFQYEIKARFLRTDDNTIEKRSGETAAVFFNIDDFTDEEAGRYCDRIRANLFPRDFTWEFPLFLEKVEKSFRICATENRDYIIAEDTEGEIHLFQRVDNDFCIERNFDTCKLDHNISLYVGTKKPTKRNNDDSGYIIFGQMMTVDGPQYSGYETQENPYWDLETVASQIVQKILIDATRERTTSLEKMLKYFSEHGGLVLTPQDSKNAGNCAVGTWNWIIEIFRIMDPVTQGVSWDHFPVALDKKYGIPPDKPIHFLDDYSGGFRRVVAMKYIEVSIDANAEKRNLMAVEPAKKPEIEGDEIEEEDISDPDENFREYDCK